MFIVACPNIRSSNSLTANFLAYWFNSYSKKHSHDKIEKGCNCPKWQKWRKILRYLQSHSTRADFEIAKIVCSWRDNSDTFTHELNGPVHNAPPPPVNFENQLIKPCKFNRQKDKTMRCYLHHFWGSISPITICCSIYCYKFLKRLISTI